MTRLRRLGAREVLRFLHRFGFEVVSTRGSHAKLVRILPSGHRQRPQVRSLTAPSPAQPCPRPWHSRPGSLTLPHDVCPMEHLVVPIHNRLASGTLRAIYRQALRFVPEAELRADFFAD